MRDIGLRMPDLVTALHITSTGQNFLPLKIKRVKKVLLLSEPRDHLEILNLYLKGVCETIVNQHL